MKEGYGKRRELNIGKGKGKRMLGRGRGMGKGRARREMMESSRAKERTN